MALAVLDGNQSATTLSSVVTGGEHIVAHSVVSLGSNAISNIATAVSGSTVCVGNLGLLQSTVATEGLPASGSFIKIGGHTGTSTTGNIVHVSAVGALRVDGSVYTQPVSIASVTIGNTVTIAGTVTANPTGTQTIAGTVTANLANVVTTDSFWGNEAIKVTGPNGYGIDIAGLDYAGRRAVFGEGGGIPVYPRGNVASGASFPISGTVTANTFALQGTAVTTSNFTSTTASTLLAGYNATREVLSIFNEGAGNLHVCAGATCTTIAYQVRLSAGDYYEVPNHQTTITHSAVFATAGTARVTEVS